MLSMILGINLGEINVPAQIVMLCAFIIMTSSFWCKNRKNILKLQIISSLLFVVQYILLGAWTGAVLNFLCIGRAYMFGLKKTGEVKGANKFVVHMKKNWILYLFVTSFLVASIVMWQGPKDILCLMAVLIYTFGMWADKPQIIRISSNGAAFFWFSYNYVVGGYIGCITETIMFVANTIAIVKNSERKIIKVK